MEIVGDGWQASAAQAGTLAALLRQVLPAHDSVALGDIWEAAVAALVLRPGPLELAAAGPLLGGWLRLGANQAAEWYRPRDRRPKRDRTSVRPVADISEVVTG